MSEPVYGVAFTFKMTEQGKHKSVSHFALSSFALLLINLSFVSLIFRALAGESRRVEEKDVSCFPYTSRSVSVSLSARCLLPGCGGASLTVDARHSVQGEKNYRLAPFAKMPHCLW